MAAFDSFTRKVRVRMRRAYGDSGIKGDRLRLFFVILLRCVLFKVMVVLLFSYVWVLAKRRVFRNIWQS